MINRLAALICGGEGADGISAQSIFDQLAGYVSSHFAYEEQRMIDAGYPIGRVEAHRLEHRRILRELQAYEAHFESGEPGTLRELLPFLYGEWLTRHICELDHDYMPYLAGQPRAG